MGCRRSSDARIFIHADRRPAHDTALLRTRPGHDAALANFDACGHTRSRSPRPTAVAAQPAWRQNLPAGLLLFRHRAYVNGCCTIKQLVEKVDSPRSVGLKSPF